MVMKKVFPLLMLLATLLVVSCGSSKHTTAVVKPRYHHTWPTNRYRVDVPVGARHIRFLERKRTKVVQMH